jgi:hypothetical protein
MPPELLGILEHIQKEIWHSDDKFYGLCSYRRKPYKSALLTPQGPACILYTHMAWWRLFQTPCFDSRDKDPFKSVVSQIFPSKSVVSEIFTVQEAEVQVN